MKWGNVCQEPQVRLTRLTPRIGASSPVDSIPQPCILASVPIPGVHLPDAATKQQPRWPPSVFHFNAVSISHRRLYFSGSAWIQKGQECFSPLGQNLVGRSHPGPITSSPSSCRTAGEDRPPEAVSTSSSLPSSRCLHHPHCSSSSPATRCGPDLHPPGAPFPPQAPSPDPPPPVHEASAEPTEVPNLPPALASSSQHGHPRPRSIPVPPPRKETGRDRALRCGGRSNEKSVTIPGLKCALDKTENPGVLLEGLLGIRHN